MPYLLHRPTGEYYGYNEVLAQREDMEPCDSLPGVPREERITAPVRRPKRESAIVAALTETPDPFQAGS